MNMRLFERLFVLGLIVAMAVSMASASTVNLDTLKPLTGGDASVGLDLSGDIVYAYNLGGKAQTVQGVTFVAASRAKPPSGITTTASSEYNYGATVNYGTSSILVALADSPAGADGNCILSAVTLEKLSGVSKDDAAGKVQETAQPKVVADDLSDTTIMNGTDWFDTEGRPIMAHEGDIARFDGVFYWYGSSYAGNPKGKGDVSDGPVWNGVQVYSSTDLKNWTYKGVCLPRPENGFGELGATGRAHVIYNEKTKKYVMWYRWYLHVPASFLMVATADHPEGPFTSLGIRQMGTSNGFASDMNVFKDDDGKAYVIYCGHGEHGVKGSRPLYAIRIDSLSDDYLTSNQDGVLVFDRGCEAPAMVKYKGKYIAVASGVHGWAPTDTVCAIADSPLGKYKRQEDVSVNKTWNSQVTDLIYIKESDTVMALCDQWWIPDKSDLNKSRYLFLPLLLDEKTGKAKMEYLDKWNPLSHLKTEEDNKRKEREQ